MYPIEDVVGGFTGKDLRTAERVIRLLADNEYTNEQLFKFNAVVSKYTKKEYQATMPKKGRTSTDSRPKKKPRSIQLLKPGETEQSNMLCPCGGKLLVEGVCGSAAINKGFVRLCTCMNCSKEFKIR